MLALIEALTGLLTAAGTLGLMAVVAAVVLLTVVRKAEDLPPWLSHTLVVAVVGFAMFMAWRVVEYETRELKTAVEEVTKEKVEAETTAQMLEVRLADSRKEAVALQEQVDASRQVWAQLPQLTSWNELKRDLEAKYGEDTPYLEGLPQIANIEDVPRDEGGEAPEGG